MDKQFTKNIEEEDKKVKVPIWLVLSCLCILVSIVIVVLYLQFIRYALVAKSIDTGNTTVSALLLTPEITMGIATLL